MKYAVAGALALCAAVLSAQTLLDVPYIRQSEDACGAASIAMVVRYWGSPADPAPIFKELYARPLHGIPVAAIAPWFSRHGFRAFEFRGEWTDVGRHIAKGRPLIVALDEPGGAAHYVVVAGVDPAAGIVFVNDPARRKLLQLDRATFERQWKNHWTLLALPQP